MHNEKKRNTYISIDMPWENTLSETGPHKGCEEVKPRTTKIHFQILLRYSSSESPVRSRFLPQSRTLDRDPDRNRDRSAFSRSEKDNDWTAKITKTRSFTRNCYFSSPRWPRFPARIFPILCVLVLFWGRSPPRRVSLQYGS